MPIREAGATACRPCAARAILSRPLPHSSGAAAAGCNGARAATKSLRAQVLANRLEMAARVARARFGARHSAAHGRAITTRLPCARHPSFCLQCCPSPGHCCANGRRAAASLADALRPHSHSQLALPRTIEPRGRGRWGRVGVASRAGSHGATSYTGRNARLRAGRGDGGGERMRAGAGRVGARLVVAGGVLVPNGKQQPLAVPPPTRRLALPANPPPTKSIASAAAPRIDLGMRALKDTGWRQTG
jgi:hypothetical protein